MNRREHRAAMLAMAAALLPATKLRALEAKMEEADSQYGLIGQMMTQPGQRAALVAILSEGTSTMPGNIAYLIGEDSANPDAIWRSEEHTSELQSLMRISYAVFCLKKKTKAQNRK